MNSSALILGSSGLVGGHLLQLLLESPHYTGVRSLVRKSSGLQHPKLNEQVVDFDRISDAENAVRGDDLFCCLGTTIRVAGSQEAFRKVDLIYVVETAGAAQRNGATRFFVVSSLGADPNSSVFYNRIKGEMEATVSRMPFLSIGILRPSLLLGERKEYRLGEKVGAIGMGLISFAMVGRARKYRPIHASAVAAGMLFLARTNFQGVRIVESDEIQRMANLSRRD
jgi:uncharacterized protein YbjT (DUF2867 family)